MRRVHFIGIGGIGMSALAQLLKDRGDEVSGSDREASPVTELLEHKGIKVVIGQRAGNVPEDISMAVYSDAVSPDNPERERTRALGAPELSYFEMLGKTSEAAGRTIAIAGTHGKTTTTGMLAKILKEAGAHPTAIIGSIVRDFESNYLPGTNDLLVVEACEYKNHLLELSPHVLVITNLEWDHTDYFDSLTSLQETFRTAIARVPAAGYIVTDTEHPNIAPLLTSAQAQIVDYTKEPAYEITLPGEFNQMNARAAAAAARVASPLATSGKIISALKDFHGTWRRFEYKGKNEHGAEVYDDYAHHPTAVKETLRALRAKTKGKVYIAFHPHLYSRTRDLLDGFARAFHDADEVLIAPIYAAREVDDGSVSSEILAVRIHSEGNPPKVVRAASFSEIEHVLATEPKSGDVIMTMGAGDIYKVADKLV